MDVLVYQCKVELQRFDRMIDELHSLKRQVEALMRTLEEARHQEQKEMTHGQKESDQV